MEEFKEILEVVIELLIPFAKSLILAIIVLVVGLFIIKRIDSFFKRRIKKMKFDETLKTFFVSLLSNLLKILLVITIINILGIDTTSIVALLATAGFAVGLAFQGALSNFAGGVLILFSKPFRVGDFIQTPTQSGTVEAIKILYTEIRTLENSIIFVPNGSLANSAITNFYSKDKRQIVLDFSASYKDDTDKVINAIKKVMKENENVLKDSEPYVRMAKHDESSIVYTSRCWVKTEHFWGVRFDIIEGVKKEFDKQNISIPFPQMDVNIKRENE